MQSGKLDVYKAVSNYTAYRITRIMSMPDAPRRAALAELRRGIGRAPGALPELWGEFLTDGESFFNDDGIVSYAKDGPSHREWAVYTALTLFALHQQGSDTSMHIEGQHFGTAVGLLVKDQDDLERVLHRFNPAATAADMSEAAHYLRGLIQILRAGSIGLDYADLASDLYRYQWSAESADNVRLKWGREFYREVHKRNKNTEEAASNE